MLNRRMPNGMYGGVRGGLNSPYSISVFQFICKGIFIILELVVYGIHISCRALYPVKHKVAVPHEVDGAVSVLFQLWVGTEF